MDKMSAHDILKLLADARLLDMHEDRLEQVVEETLRQADEEELADEELEQIAAARGNPQSMDPLKKRT